MKGCLLIHGFTGGPHEVKPLADYMSEHTDWNIYTPTLAGHGKEYAIASTTWKDWIQSAEEALKQAVDECDELYLIGFSMGSLIAGYLASRYPITKLILLSPAVYAPNTPQLLRELAEVARDLFYEQEYALKSIERFKRKLTTTPLKAVIHYKRLVHHVKPKLKEIEVPVFIIHGEKDHVANPKSAHYVYDCVKSAKKKLLLLKDSKHIVCHDCEKEILFEKVDEFLQTNTLQTTDNDQPEHIH